MRRAEGEGPRVLPGREGRPRPLGDPPVKGSGSEAGPGPWPFRQPKGLAGLGRVARGLALMFGA